MIKNNVPLNILSNVLYRFMQMWLVIDALILTIVTINAPIFRMLITR